MNYRTPLRKQLARALIISAVIVWILVGIISAGINSYMPVYHPVNIMAGLRTGLSWKIALLLHLIVWAFLTWTTINGWKNNLHKDKLDNNRKFSITAREFGSHHFAEPYELSKEFNVRPIDECKGIPIVQLTEDGSQAVDFYAPTTLNRNVFCIAAPGRGKSFSLCMPWIYAAAKPTMRHSLVVTDPKGELYENMGPYLEANGYIVRRLDLINLDKSDGWDMLGYVKAAKDDLDELQRRVSFFSAAVIENIVQKKESGGDIYVNGSKALLRALVLYTMLSPDIKDDKRNIAKVQQMLEQSGLDYFEEIFGGTAPKILSPAVNAYKTFKQASPNLYGNIISNLATGLQVLQTKGIIKILTKDDIHLDEIGERPMAVFCRIPIDDKPFTFISATFFTMLFRTLMDQANRRPGKDKRVKNDVDIIMDEAASIGAIPDFPSILSNIRSYHISAIIIIQVYSQLMALYGKEHDVIVGDCSTLINFGLNDDKAAELFQNKIGNTTFVLEKDGKKEEKSDYLMSMADLSHLSQNQALVLFQSYPPILGYKVGINKAYPEFGNYRPFSDADIPSIDDYVGRRRRQEAENRRLDEYYKTHSPEPVKKTETYEPFYDYPRMTTLQILKLILKDTFALLFRKKELIEHYKTEQPMYENENMPDDFFGDEEDTPYVRPTPPAKEQEHEESNDTEQKEMKPVENETQPVPETPKQTVSPKRDVDLPDGAVKSSRISGLKKK